jgi:hypothetical protein
MSLSSSAKLILPISDRLPRTAIMLECVGFLAIICISWLDELIDLPYYLFGAPPSPFRPEEAIVESVVTLLVGKRHSDARGYSLTFQGRSSSIRIIG